MNRSDFLLTQTELKELFNAAIDNAHQLMNAAQQIAFDSKSKKFPSLGLAELALEELGKSYSCLAWLSQDINKADWKQFWKEWKQHDTKAYRGFFYEFFCLLRLEIDDPLFKQLPTPRGKFSKEKELSFYVDIDHATRKIHIPGEDIVDKECVFRIASLIGLLNGALHVQDWINSNESQSFKKAIYDYAYRTISTEMYQQDVENVLRDMKTSDVDYNRGLQRIWNTFQPEKGN